ncbi:hypothetical protein S40285_07392 [Stachybotrys chlorohalonatus IBT 40285]|uniref:MULE transposase domain-containing protein n=1 Tax=Stachybotrys chlorohalonatus (strain IBT 40285) TaxID=1283841 RepID=A0A084Q8J4_STAC4|nr:hypothetical protein S40285_07392 [Stachybotrys chlorohalonata IBT 40285]
MEGYTLLGTEDIPLDRQNPPPPPSGLYETHEKLIEHLQTFYVTHGAAVVTLNSNKRKTHGIMKLSSITIVCDKSGKCKWEGAGKWSYRVLEGRHNHPKSLDPAAHPSHRKFNAGQQVLLQNMTTKHVAIPAHEAGSLARDLAPETSFFTNKDIYNERQRVQKRAPGGLTPTQRFVSNLREKGLRHRVKYQEDRHIIEAIFWTYPTCESNWRRFPEVLGMDNTYKTNRYGLFLFQIIAITPHNTVANVVFGLTSTEVEEGYSWSLAQLEEFRSELDISRPSIIITDKENALKNALAACFPLTQQQVCLYHINANVKGKINTLWKDPAPETAVETASANESPSPLPAEEEVESLTSNPDAPDSSAPGPSTAATEDKIPSQEGLFKAWKSLCWQAEEEEFQHKWLEIRSAYSPHQDKILDYLEREKMPYHHQWALCHTRHYRNFGQRTNSPVETAHNAVKTFLVTGTGHLLTLGIAIKEMLAHKERSYKAKSAEQANRAREDHIGRGFLGHLPTKITCIAIELIIGQYRVYCASLLPRNTPLSPCNSNCTFMQYALPYCHKIAAAEEEKVALTIESVHPRWWLDEPLDLEEPLLRIRDPKMVQNLHGRPRLPLNNKLPVQRSSQSSQRSSQRSQLPSSRAGGRRINRSLKRTATTAEIEAGTRGRGRQGRGGRGGRQGPPSSSDPLAGGIE